MEPAVCSTCGVALERDAPACRVCGATPDFLISDGAHAPHLVKRGARPTEPSADSAEVSATRVVPEEVDGRPTAVDAAAGGAPAPESAGDFNAKSQRSKDAKKETSSLGASAPLRQTPAPDGAVHIKAAGFWHRLIAFLVDAAIVGLVAFALNRASVGPFSTTKLPDLNLTWFDQIAEVILRHSKVILPAIIANLCLCFAYVYFHLVFLGRTPGKLLVGLRVIDTKGRKIGPIRAFIRTLAYIPSGLCFGMGFLWAAFDVERRAVHDLIAGTFVIRGQPRPAETTATRSVSTTPAASALG
ncbi:MAG: RDD family protein [Deltaproteobacteria bacterium]|nr:RDD family protein [Deltaproteobacteria bacterium]